MTRVLYILCAILVFGVIVIVHEFGHFITAKLCGVQVDEFAVGMGPVLWKRKRGETQISVRAIPFGGFCAMHGEDESCDDDRAFTSQKGWKRAIILFAGSFMNLVLGFVLLLMAFSKFEAFPAPMLYEFLEGCPYHTEDGFHTEDVIVKIDGKYVFELDDFIERVKSGDTHDYLIERDGERIELKNFTMVPVDYPDQEKKMYGFTAAQYGATATFGSYLAYCCDTTGYFAGLVWESLGMLVSGEAAVSDLSGPIGIVDVIAETGESAETKEDAAINILNLAAFIAINLAIMNLLPIPGLDGGRIFGLIVTGGIELIIGKKLDPKYEGYVHAAGLILLLLFMVFVMFNDIVRLVK